MVNLIRSPDLGKSGHGLPKTEGYAGTTALSWLKQGLTKNYLIGSPVGAAFLTPMPRKLVFDYHGTALSFEMNKVDRSRLYGFKQLQVLDENGAECELATLADDGKTLIGKGGTGIGYLTADGNWSHKDELKAVNLEGEEIVPVPSSFAAPIELKTETTIDDYLNHNIRLIYQMSTDSDLGDLFSELKEGTIYRFDYSYRGGLEADCGFLLMNNDDEIFFLVGDATHVEYVGLQQTASVTPEDDDTAAEDLMDFGMI